MVSMPRALSRVPPCARSDDVPSPLLHRKRGPRTRPGKPIQPTAIQLAYFQWLRRLVADMRALTEARLIPALPSLLSDFHGDARADAGAGPRINRIVAQMIATFGRRWHAKRVAEMPAKVGRLTSDHQRRELFRQIKAGLGIELDTVADRGLMKLIRHFTAENVSLIRTVPQEYFSQVEKVALAGVKAGRRAKDIAEDLRVRANVAQSRVKVIARDQVSKFQGDMNHVRQSDLGIKRFRWMTMGDNRVREVHAARNGKSYAWADPPGDAGDPADGALPGAGIQCRCFGAPDLSDLLAELDAK